MYKHVKILIFVFVCLLSQNVFAQIPQNNLGKTKVELEQKFNNLRFTEARNNLKEYESDGITFTFKYGKVVAECMGVDNGRQFGYDWFHAMIESFLKTSYTRVTELSNDNMMMSRTFYYPSFWITLSYWKDDGYTTITYQNSDYFK